MRLIVLAAGQGERLRPLTDDRPKCLVELAGETLLDRQLRVAREMGLADIVVVAGYRAEQLHRPGIAVVVNEHYATTNMVRSLFCAERFFGEGFVLSYGDIAYAPGVLRRLLGDSSPVAVAVDCDWRRYWEMRFVDPLRDAESLRTDGDGRIVSIGRKETEIERIEAQYIGLLALRGRGVDMLRDAYRAAEESARLGRGPFDRDVPLQRLFMTDLLQGMVDLGYPVAAVPIDGGWVEVDSLSDLHLAERLVAAGRLAGV